MHHQSEIKKSVISSRQKINTTMPQKRHLACYTAPFLLTQLAESFSSFERVRGEGCYAIMARLRDPRIPFCNVLASVQFNDRLKKIDLCEEITVAERIEAVNQIKIQAINL